jgi:hypothetical protein
LHNFLLDAVMRRVHRNNLRDLAPLAHGMVSYGLAFDE